jgi:tetratricopeptide (TPR) repeat protein
MGSRRAPRPATRASVAQHPRLIGYALALAVVALAVYANAISAPFVLDDTVSVLDNPEIRQLWSLDVLAPQREQPVAGRPLPNLTLAINYALGGTDPRGYHAVNLLFHTLCAIAVLLLVREALRLPSLRDRFEPYSTEIAFTSALLWLVHPLNSEVVNYVTQRTESMMALCYLLTLYASLRALGARGARWTVVAIVCCLLGMGSKESMATAPLMVVLVDRVFVFSSWAEAFKQRKWLYAGLFATWALLAVLLLTGPRIHSAGFGTNIGVWTYLLNQTRMIVRYLWLVVWPLPLVVYYGFPPPVALVDVLPQALLVSALAVVTLAAFRYRPYLAFLGAWFFITLAPSSSIVPIATEVGAERRMYLPLIAIVVGIVAAVVPRAAAASRITPLYRHGALAVIVLLLAGATFARNREYDSALHLAEVTLERWPTGVAHHMFGEQLVLAGRSDEAIAHLREAVATAPRAHYSLGAELLRRGQTTEGISQLQEFIAREPLLLEVPAAHILLARAYAQQGNWTDAATQAREAIRKAPGNPDGYGVLANVLLKLESFGDAVKAYTAYLRLRPGDADGWTSMGVALAATQQNDAAVDAFRRTVDLTPRSGEAQRNLATALLDANRPNEAAAAARLAIELRPRDAVSYDLLGQALAREGNFEEARAALERAVAADPANTEAQQHLAQIVALLRR